MNRLDYGDGVSGDASGRGEPEMTANRALPCLFEEIVPLLEVGKTVLVAAHGNSLDRW